jgi:hypothetical protein
LFSKELVLITAPSVPVHRALGLGSQEKILEIFLAKVCSGTSEQLDVQPWTGGVGGISFAAGLLNGGLDWDGFGSHKR